MKNEHLNEYVYSRAPFLNLDTKPLWIKHINSFNNIIQVNNSQITVIVESDPTVLTIPLKHKLIWSFISLLIVI